MCVLLDLSIRSLMVELTLPSVAPGDFHPASMEDLFEAAVHSVRDTKAMRRLWLEYLSFLRAQLMAGGGTYQHFKVEILVFVICLLRPLFLYGWL